MTRLAASQYLNHLHHESARFRAVLTDANPRATVPTCPEWDVADLLWHLTEVQYFWARTINHRPAAPDPEKGWGRPPRPESYAELLGFFDECSANLENALTGADPDETAWSWSTDQTVRFTFRRQAHEALIHRLDAELVVGDVTPLDPRLAADGVDEMLDIMLGEAPPWASFTPDDAVVAVHARDTDHEFRVRLGRTTGTDPEGTTHDQDDFRVIDEPGVEPDAVLEGRAEDLDAWLWHRRDDAALEWVGDHAVRQRFTDITAEPMD